MSQASRTQVVSHYRVNLRVSWESGQANYEGARRRLAPLLAEALLALTPGHAALVTYEPIEEKDDGYGVLDCTLRVTIEPYRVG